MIVVQAFRLPTVQAEAREHKCQVLAAAPLSGPVIASLNPEGGQASPSGTGWGSGRVRVVIVGDQELDLGPVAGRFDPEHGQDTGLHPSLECRV